MIHWKKVPIMDDYGHSAYPTQREKILRHYRAHGWVAGYFICDADEFDKAGDDDLKEFKASEIDWTGFPE